jgi:hypothetical protein
METKICVIEIAIGLLEDVQNVALWQTFRKEAFIPFLGSQMTRALNKSLTVT